MKYLFALTVLGFLAWAFVNAFRRPGLLAAAFLCSYGYAIYFGSLGGGLGLLTVLVTVSTWAVRPVSNFRSPPTEFPLLVWALLSILTMFIALYPDVVGNILAALIVLAGGGYIVGRTHGDSEEFIRDVVLGCFGALLLCAPYISLTVRGSGDLSVAQNSVGLAVLQEVPMVATFALLLFDNSLSVKLRRSLWVTFVLVIIPFSIVLANRSSVLAGAVVFAYFFVLRIRRGNARKLIWGTLASLIALIGFGFLVLTQLHNVSGLGVLTRGVDRIAINLTLSQRGQGAFTDPSSQGRLDLYHQSVDLISQAPIFGHGIGAFGYLANYQVLDIYPHNMILEILINNGVVGLLFFLAALLPLLWFALRRAWPTNAGWQPIFIAGVLIEALVRHQVSMSITTGKLLFFTMGVISAQWAGLLKRREVKAEPDGVQSLPG